MSVIIKISAVTLIYICCAVFIRQYRPEYTLLLRFTAIIIIVFLLLGEAKPLLDDLNEIFSQFNISTQHLALLLKVGFIALLSDFIIDTLKDSGDNSLAGIVSVGLRIVIISFSMPVLKGIIIICKDLIV